MDEFNGEWDYPPGVNNWPPIIVWEEIINIGLPFNVNVYFERGCEAFTQCVYLFRDYQQQDPDGFVEYMCESSDWYYERSPVPQVELSSIQIAWLRRNIRLSKPGTLFYNWFFIQNNEPRYIHYAININNNLLSDSDTYDSDSDIDILLSL